MKVFFDHQIFALQTIGGVSKYFFEIMKRLPKDMWITSTLFSNNEYIKSVDFFDYYKLFQNLNFKGKAHFLNELNKIYTRIYIRNVEFDIYHQTHYDNYCFGEIKNKKVVTTFHDMNHTKYSHLYEKSLINRPSRIEKLQKLSLERADIIISVSQNTKNDLIELWNINPNKIQVIHHGISPVSDIVSENNNRIHLKPYVLFVGGRSGFKNFKKFLDSFVIVSNKFKDLDLICTGFPFSTDELKIFFEKKINNKVFHFQANEMTMNKLYKDAECFIYPSLYEGFGMPILESMANGCPVIVSDSSSFPEVAGDAALYFDPNSIEEIAEKLELVLFNGDVRRIKIAEGYERIKHFTWEKSSYEHLAVYNSLV